MVVVSCSPVKPSEVVTESKIEASESFKETKIEESTTFALESMPATQGLTIIPVEITETLDHFPTPFPAKKVARRDTFNSSNFFDLKRNAEQGWKYVNIRLALENSSNSFVTINYWDNLPDIKLKTEQGWVYELEDTSASTVEAFLPWWRFRYTPTTERFKIPSGFRIAGDNLFTNYARDTWCEPYYLRFKVAEKSSGYTLSIQGYPDIVLKSDLNNLVFPTTLPNSSFTSVGDVINIPDKGSIKILDFSRDPNSDRATLRVELSNASGGYDQKFNLGFIFVGDDGIFTCQGTEAEEDLTTVLNFPESITVGPGITNFLYFIQSNIPIDVKNIKLILTGDIDAVMNLD